MRSEVFLIVIPAVCCIATIGISAFLVRRANREKEKARREVVEEKSAFLSRISYDLKTPMNVIIGTTALGMEDISDPEKMKDCLERISMAGNFMLELLNGLVDMSKIENGRFHLHPKSYAFREFLEEIRGMFEPDCRNKGIAFEMPDLEMNLNLMVDPLRYQQIFFNLLSNAVKFTPKGGKVTFRICNYAVHDEIFSADYVVGDTGIGMSEEFQKILFEPFTQEQAVEGKNGMGLGLAITRNLVDMMGGTITLKSECGKGTQVRVHLDLPIAAIQPETTGILLAEEKVRQILSGNRILLAEDHPLNIEVTRRILEHKGMEVVCVQDGREAVKLFAESPADGFDLILMDIYMPGLDGLEATKQIRRLPHPKAPVIPVIALTANNSSDNITACREAGMNACVSKPVEPKHLYQVLCEYLEAPL